MMTNRLSDNVMYCANRVKPFHSLKRNKTTGLLKDCCDQESALESISALIQRYRLAAASAPLNLKDKPSFMHKDWQRHCVMNRHPVIENPGRGGNHIVAKCANCGGCLPVDLAVDSAKKILQIMLSWPGPLPASCAATGCAIEFVVEKVVVAAPTSPLVPIGCTSDGEDEEVEEPTTESTLCDAAATTTVASPRDVVVVKKAVTTVFASPPHACVWRPLSAAFGYSTSPSSSPKE